MMAPPFELVVEEMLIIKGKHWSAVIYSLGFMHRLCSTFDTYLSHTIEIYTFYKLARW